MPVDRIFVSSALSAGKMVVCENAEFHHLIHVLRFKEGEKIELVDGRGSLARASIHRIEKKRADLKVESVIVEERPPRDLILAQALPRINRLDFIIEKGTELGITQFWLFPGVYSERKVLTQHQVERLQNLAIAAMKQCGRLYLPEIALKTALSNWKTTFLPAYFGDLSPVAAPFVKVFDPSQGGLFIVGPETGFSEEEIHRLKTLGVMGVKLHPHILRTDTAGLVAATLMSVGSLMSIGSL